MGRRIVKFKDTAGNWKTVCEMTVKILAADGTWKTIQPGQKIMGKDGNWHKIVCANIYVKFGVTTANSSDGLKTNVNWNYDVYNLYGDSVRVYWKTPESGAIPAGHDSGSTIVSDGGGTYSRYQRSIDYVRDSIDITITGYLIERAEYGHNTLSISVTIPKKTADDNTTDGSTPL
jgi:hypothetical protein